MEHGNYGLPIKTAPGLSNVPLQNDSILSKDVANHPFGAAFSLASLDQGNSRGSLSCMNLNMSFDTGVFLKSGSFDCLHNLLGSQGSQLFKMEPNQQSIAQASMDKVHLQTVANQSLQSSNNGSAVNLSAPISVPNNSVLNVSHLKSIIPTSIPSNVIATSVPNSNLLSQSPPNSHQIMSFGNNALIQPKENDKRLVERKDENSKFVDVTPFLTLPQHEAAKKLGIPSSTLAKRWKEASCNRKWPYRTVSKLDKEILTLLKNVENAKAELSPSVEATLGLLLKKRQEELKTVLVRL